MLIKESASHLRSQHEHASPGKTKPETCVSATKILNLFNLPLTYFAGRNVLLFALLRLVTVFFLDCVFVNFYHMLIQKLLTALLGLWKKHDTMLFSQNHNEFKIVLPSLTRPLRLQQRENSYRVEVKQRSNSQSPIISVNKLSTINRPYRHLFPCLFKILNHTK